jgi:1-acyl-sn-glycerol-3-phosphate acyltransferase
MRLQRVARALLRKPARLLWPVDVFGADRIPTVGAAVLCPNHLSFFDSVLMMLTFDRPVYFIGKSDYLDRPITRRLFPAMGMIPVDRDCGAKAMVALDAASSVLEHGALLCVYPEGTRSRDGYLHRGHTGAARLALSADCPLLPVGIRGTVDIQPPGTRVPRLRRRCTVAVGEPVIADTEVASRRVAARDAIDEVMRRVAALSGQQYVPTYARREPADQAGNTNSANVYVSVASSYVVT